MSAQNTVKKQPTLFIALFPIVAMLLIVGIGFPILKLPLTIVLLLSSVMAALTAKYLGYTWSEMQAAVGDKIGQSTGAILILIGVGMMVDSSIVILEGIYRKDIYELPPDSIRELIINAVMNCSFLQSSRIQVAIYDDRLEIISLDIPVPTKWIEMARDKNWKLLVIAKRIREILEDQLDTRGGIRHAGRW